MHVTPKGYKLCQVEDCTTPWNIIASILAILLLHLLHCRKALKQISLLTDKVLVTTYETPVHESGEADQDEDSLKDKEKTTQEFIIADNKDNEMAVDKGKFKMKEKKLI